MKLLKAICYRLGYIMKSRIIINVIILKAVKSSH